MTCIIAIAGYNNACRITSSNCGSDNDAVIAGTAVDGIASRTAGDEVVAATAGNDIVAAIAIDEVGTSAAGNRIIAIEIGVIDQDAVDAGQARGVDDNATSTRHDHIRFDLEIARSATLTRVGGRHHGVAHRNIEAGRILAQHQRVDIGDAECR